MMKDERKNQIFSSALKLFASNGLAAIKISDIATDANFSQGLIYHYFKSKEEIFEKLISIAFEKLIFATKQLNEMKLPVIEKIELAYNGLMQNIIENKDSARYHLLIANSSSSTNIPQEVKTIIKKNHNIPYEIMQTIFETGQEEGNIIMKNPKELSLLFWSVIRGLAIYKSIHGESFQVPDASIFLQMFKKVKE